MTYDSPARTRTVLEISRYQFHFRFSAARSQQMSSHHFVPDPLLVVAAVPQPTARKPPCAAKMTKIRASDRMEKMQLPKDHTYLTLHTCNMQNKFLILKKTLLNCLSIISGSRSSWSVCYCWFICLSCWSGYLVSVLSAQLARWFTRANRVRVVACAKVVGSK